MTILEAVGTLVAVLLGAAALTALFVRVVALPYLKEHLIGPVLERLDRLALKDSELETGYRLAAGMFEGHITHSETDRGRLWEAIGDLRRALGELRRDQHRHITDPPTTTIRGDAS